MFYMQCCWRAVSGLTQFVVHGRMKSLASLCHNIRPLEEECPRPQAINHEVRSTEGRVVT